MNNDSIFSRIRILVVALTCGNKGVGMAIGCKKSPVVLAGLLILVLLLLSPSVYGSQSESPLDTPVRDLIIAGLNQGKSVCAVVQELIRAGRDCSEIVNNSIVMGHPACVVVRCAIEAGGKLEDVITAAYRAGATADIIVTCLVEAGVDTDVLASTIERLGLPGLGYTPPPAGAGYSPTFAPTIGGGGGGIVSPIRP